MTTPVAAHSDNLARESAQGIDPAWVLLEAVAMRTRVTPTAQEMGCWLGSPSFQWGELIEQALRHKLLPSVARMLLDAVPSRAMPPLLRLFLQDAWALNRHRIALYQRELDQISGAMDAEEVPHSVTKGSVLQHLVYGADYSRYAGRDIDFMVLPEDATRVNQIMCRLGYTSGWYDWHSQTVRPHERQVQIKYARAKDHLPHYVRATGDLCVPCIRVDFAMSFSWDNAEYQVPVQSALSTTSELRIGAASFRTMSLEHNALFTVLHLFREAWFPEYESDVNLMKFGDVVGILDTCVRTDGGSRFRALVDEHGLSAPVAWVLAHTDATFGTSFLALLPDLKPLEGKFLHGASDFCGGTREWTGTMRERLQARGKLQGSPEVALANGLFA